MNSPQSQNRRGLDKRIDDLSLSQSDIESRQSDDESLQNGKEAHQSDNESNSHTNADSEQSGEESDEDSSPSNVNVQYSDEDSQHSDDDSAQSDDESSQSFLELATYGSPSSDNDTDSKNDESDVNSQDSDKSLPQSDEQSPQHGAMRINATSSPVYNSQQIKVKEEGALQSDEELPIFSAAQLGDPTHKSNATPQTDKVSQRNDKDTSKCKKRFASPKSQENYQARSDVIDLDGYKEPDIIELSDSDLENTLHLLSKKKKRKTSSGSSSKLVKRVRKRITETTKDKIQLPRKPKRMKLRFPDEDQAAKILSDEDESFGDDESETHSSSVTFRQGLKDRSVARSTENQSSRSRPPTLTKNGSFKTERVLGICMNPKEKRIAVRIRPKEIPACDKDSNGTVLLFSYSGMPHGSLGGTIGQLSKPRKSKGHEMRGICYDSLRDVYICPVAYGLERIGALAFCGHPGNAVFKINPNMAYKFVNIIYNVKDDQYVAQEATSGFHDITIIDARNWHVLRTFDVHRKRGDPLYPGVRGLGFQGHKAAFLYVRLQEKEATPYLHVRQEAEDRCRTDWRCPINSRRCHALLLPQGDLMVADDRRNEVVLYRKRLRNSQPGDVIWKDRTERSGMRMAYDAENKILVVGGKAERNGDVLHKMKIFKLNHV